MRVSIFVIAFSNGVKLSETTELKKFITMKNEVYSFIVLQIA